MKPNVFLCFVFHRNLSCTLHFFILDNCLLKKTPLNIYPHFFILFIIKDNANNGRNPHSCLFPIVAFISEENTGCINEEATGAISEATTGAIIAPRNPPSCFIYFMFLFHLSVTDEVALVANLGKTSLTKGTSKPNNTFFLKLPDFLPKNSPQ